MLPFYYVAKGLAQFFLWLLTKWQIRGLENVPGEGPLIVVANHLHNADIPLLAASLPRNIAFMAKEELFRFWGRLAVKLFETFPVKRGGLNRAALRQAIRVLRDGKVLGIFPEGTRSRSGCLQRARPGVALIAQYSGAPILPVGISGTEKIAGAFWWLRRLCVSVNIGQPFNLPPAPSGLNKETKASHTDIIMGHIAELLPADYRGVYGEKPLAEPSVAGVAPGRSKGDGLAS